MEGRKGGREGFKVALLSSRMPSVTVLASEDNGPWE